MSEQEQRTFIYALIEPGGSADDPSTVRYIGKTNNPKRRLRNHINRAKRKSSTIRKHRWIRKLIREGKRPEIIILESCALPEWEEREGYYISKYNRLGSDLTNHTNGGEGMSSELMREMWKNPDSPYNDPDFLARRGVSSAERWEDPDYRQKMVKAMRRAWQREDAIRNKSLGQKRRYEDPDELERLGQRTKDFFAGMSKEERREFTSHLRKEGEENLSSKLTREQVVEIRERYAANDVWMKELAKEYGVSRTTVRGIVHGKSWRHVDGPITQKSRRGKHNPAAKLTPIDVRRIRDMHTTGDYSLSALGIEFDVSWTTIKNVVTRNTWKHID